MRVQRLIVATMLCAGLATPAAASAITPITYTFSGLITEVSNDDVSTWMPGVTVGTEFSGSLGITPGASAVDYALFDLNVGTQIIRVSTAGPGMDNLMAQFAQGEFNGFISAPAIQGGGYIEKMAFVPTPTEPLSLGTISILAFGMGAGLNGHDGTFHVGGQITSLQTPEPSTWMLLLVGVAVLGTMHKKKLTHHCTSGCGY